MSKKCYENSFQNSYINRCESRYENYENSERYGYNNRRPRAIIYGVNSRCNNNCRCGCKTTVDVITNLAAIAVVNVVAINQHHAAQMLYHTLL